MPDRDWARLALVLDLRLAGWPLQAIGDRLGISKQRADSLVKIAARRLAHRVYGTPRYGWRWLPGRRRWIRIE